MTYERNPLHEAADKVAELTGVPKLMRMAEANQSAHRARRQIVLPAIAIAGSVIAFIATLNGVTILGALSAFFFVLALLAQQFGPVRPHNAAIPYDECEQLLIWRSRSIGSSVALGLAIIGCSTISLFEAFQHVQYAAWQLPANSALAAMWLLVTTATALTTISASMLLPKEIAEEDM